MEAAGAFRRRERQVRSWSIGVGDGDSAGSAVSQVRALCQAPDSQHCLFSVPLVLHFLLPSTFLPHRVLDSKITSSHLLQGPQWGFALDNYAIILDKPPDDTTFFEI